MEHAQRAPRPTEAFVAFLAGLAAPASENRAALAALRRGLGKPPGEAAELFPYVVPWIPQQASAWEETTYYLVASLFALHPVVWPDESERGSSRNFGASMARLSVNQDRREAVERRFVALLNAHRDDVAEHVRRAVAMLKAADIPVDWAQLLEDLRRWDWQDRPVQRRWAKSFWAELARAGTAQQGSAASSA